MIEGKTTLKSLAQILNVSISTVSKSLSNNSEISEDTKLKVKALASKYNYTPNQFAVNLRKGRTKTIGVIIPNVLNPFFAKVLIGLEHILSSKGYNVITSFSHELNSKEKTCIEAMSNGHIDGLIMCLAKETQISSEWSHLDALINKGLPIVLFDRIHKNFKCDKVIINDFEAAFNATNYLIKNKNCNKIVLVSSINNLELGKLRLKGYKASLKHNNINDDYIVTTSNFQDFKFKILQLIATKKLDGFFGVNDAALTTTINIIKDKGYNLKKDFSIAGFCNQYQKINYPSLIIINQHANEIGEKTAEIMLKRLKKNNLNFTTTTIKASINEA